MTWHHKRLESSPADENDDWMLTYADIITLLLAFFVLLLSISKVNQTQYETVKAGIVKQMSHHATSQPFSVIFDDLSTFLHDLIKQKQVRTMRTQTGIVVEFASSLLYTSGSDQLRQTAQPILLRITSAVKKMPYKHLTISIEGHTDDLPIHTHLFPSNWELSSNRATQVVRFFIAHGIDKKHIKAVAFADTHPRFPNRDKDGRKIPENMEKNRRVIIRLERS